MRTLRPLLFVLLAGAAIGRVATAEEPVPARTAGILAPDELTHIHMLGQLVVSDITYCIRTRDMMRM